MTWLVYSYAMLDDAPYGEALWLRTWQRDHPIWTYSSFEAVRFNNPEFAAAVALMFDGKVARDEGDRLVPEDGSCLRA